MQLPILPHSNPITQRRTVITMMTLMQNISTTERAPMSLKNPQSLPNAGMRRYTSQTTMSCKVCRCFSVESNSFKATKNPTIAENTSRAWKWNTTNPIIPKNPTINITLSNQFTNMVPVRKLPSRELTSKLSRTIPKGQNPSSPVTLPNPCSVSILRWTVTRSRRL